MKIFATQYNMCKLTTLNVTLTNISTPIELAVYGFNDPVSWFSAAVAVPVQCDSYIAHRVKYCPNAFVVFSKINSYTINY